VKYDDPAFKREGHHRPGGQEATDIGTVGDSLTPAVLEEDVRPHPAEPDDEHGDQRDVVDHGEEREVETGALAGEAGGPDVDEEGDGVTDDANEYDDREDVGIEDLHGPLEGDVRLVER